MGMLWTSEPIPGKPPLESEKDFSLSNSKDDEGSDFIPGLCHYEAKIIKLRKLFFILERSLRLISNHNSSGNCQK